MRNVWDPKILSKFCSEREVDSAGQIGLKSSSVRKKPRTLPPDLVTEFKLLRSMEKRWKTLNSEAANSVTEEVTRAENNYLAQKNRTEELFYLHFSDTPHSLGFSYYSQIYFSGIV